MMIFFFSLVLAFVILYPVASRILDSSQDRTEEYAELLAEPEIKQYYIYEDLRESGYTYQFALGANGRLILRETGEESEIYPLDTDGDGFADYGYIEVESSDPSQPHQQVKMELYAENGLPCAEYAVYPVPIPSPMTLRTGWQTIGDKKYYYYNDGSRSVGLNRIDGKLYFFNEFGECANALGVDVSIYDERIDWKAVKEQGIDFAVIRVGGRGWASGLHYGDIRTRENLNGARAYGIKLGAYFFSTAINEFEAIEDAKAALRTLQGFPLELPVFIDMEYSGVYPDGRADLLTSPQRVAIARAFCETIRAGGYRPGIYSGEYYYKYSMNYPAVAQYLIWLASYTRNSRLPNFTGRYDIWQFTDSGTVRGIPGYSDMNAIF